MGDMSGGIGVYRGVIIFCLGVLGCVGFIWFMVAVLMIMIDGTVNKYNYNLLPNFWYFSRSKDNTRNGSIGFMSFGNV